MTVLVAHASKHGSTAEIAEAVAGRLRQEGVAADCLPAAGVAEPAAYDAVVLGSAVYVKHWRREAVRLLRRLEDADAPPPLWIFSSGPIGEAELDPSWCEPAGVLARAERLGLRGHAIFGGRVPQDPRNFVERAMLRDTPPETADRRDWEAIGEWAAAIASELSPAPSPR